ncbi:hypothetical protein, partial [Achromobacter xylosoxidans]|uniref:hypothetical protein n=1 Tax=Alcaligenes xylosoxydans xylosoxydans TaxID=85698 RepID=UPI001F13E125
RAAIIPVTDAPRWRDAGARIRAAARALLRLAQNRVRRPLPESGFGREKSQYLEQRCRNALMWCMEYVNECA